MSEHRYEQYCALARALDVVGDRWTLLIVRELMLGPRRFTDLVDGLPGVSRNLLTRRLRSLENEGVLVRQELPPPAARWVYELTDDGRDLADALVPMIAWGARRLGERQPTEDFRARWAALAMATFANRDAARGVSETYQYVIGDSAFHFSVDDGSIRLHDGYAPDAAVTLTTDEDTWTDITSGKVTASDAAASGALTVEGDARAAKRLGRIFSRDPLFAVVEGTITRAGKRQRARA